MKASELSVVLAEDNPDHALLITENLQMLHPGNQVHHVENGEALIAHLEYCLESGLLPDLVLLDIKMPRMNGIEALKAIKLTEGLKSIPIVMITTSASQSEIETCYELGASSYIIKPLDYDDLARKMSDFVRYWGATSELPLRDPGDTDAR